MVGLTVGGLVLRCVGLVLSSDGSEERGAHAAVTTGKDQDTEQEVPVPLRTQGTLWASDVMIAAGKARARMSSLA